MYNTIFSCKEAALEVLMSVRPSIRGQVEILAFMNFMNVQGRFLKVPERSRKVPEGTGKVLEDLEGSGKVQERFRKNL